MAEIDDEIYRKKKELKLIIKPNSAKSSQLITAPNTANNTVNNTVVKKLVDSASSKGNPGPTDENQENANTSNTLATNNIFTNSRVRDNEVGDGPSSIGSGNLSPCVTY